MINRGQICSIARDDLQENGFTRQALGETGIPTQIDVTVEGVFAQDVRRLQFVEVKFIESQFGACRGAKGGRARANPARNRLPTGDEWS